MAIPKDYRGAARRMTDEAIARVAHQLGCDEDAIHAVLDVEARGSGFDDHGRPAMLFEPHVFYRNLKGAKQDRAVRAGLAYPKWRKGYPRDSYPRLIAAAAIDMEAAHKASSWGLSQILGENCKEAGFGTAIEMVEACCESEDRQIAMMAAVIRARNLRAALIKRDWATFARSWNGPAYKDNAYDVRLAQRFAWWDKRPDTPWSPQIAAAETVQNDPSAPGAVFLPQGEYVPLPTPPFLTRVANWWRQVVA